MCKCFSKRAIGIICRLKCRYSCRNVFPAEALDTSNVTVKKQVFELLSALCVYNSDGYERALDALEHYKKLKCARYRLKVVVDELQAATAVDYQTALVAFLNCLIISTADLKERIRIRNEFIGTTNDSTTVKLLLMIVRLWSYYNDSATVEKLKCARYRLKVVVDELQAATAVDYQTALVAFLNCLIISTADLKERIRIRNEFIGTTNDSTTVKLLLMIVRLWSYYNDSATVEYHCGGTTNDSTSVEVIIMIVPLWSYYNDSTTVEYLCGGHTNDSTSVEVLLNYSTSVEVILMIVPLVHSHSLSSAKILKCLEAYVVNQKLALRYPQIPKVRGGIYIWAEWSIALGGRIQGAANFGKKVKNKLFQKLQICEKKLLVIHL
ncbi:FH2 domain-containing protein 1 [Homalodisca vitripennis]|nr:FH2 domain-containing protein 1 [Homalodisca vitripennis]